MNLCQYKDILGKPNAGWRVYRIYDIAIFDVLATAIIVYAICWLFNLPYLPVLLFSYILGIFAHRIFCVRTGLDKKLFPQ